MKREIEDMLVTDPVVVEAYSGDQATWARVGRARAVARPESTEEVQRLVAWAGRNRVPLVPRGLGSGISGGANAIDECVIVSLERMKRIVTLDDSNMLAVVQPGLINGDLKVAALERGCWYPPDPSSFAISSLGGNVATNAGGLCCAKYGVTGDYVLALEAVLGDGRVLRTGSRSRTDVAGYDLKRLLVGSEGTLAIVTEITFRLRRPLPPASTLVATFPTLESAAKAIFTAARTADPLLLELMDRTAIRAVEEHARLELDLEARATLFAQSDATVPREMGALRAACEGAGATFVAVSDDEQEAQLLLNARRIALTALKRLGTVLLDDVAVPLSALAEMFRRIEAASEENDTLVATVAHAASGNLHPAVIFDRSDPAAVERADKTFERLMLDAIALGGSITGEHGIGSLKCRFLPDQIGPVSLALQQAIKNVFDPYGILNPGKVFASATAA